jgi:hypothetical protein
MTENSNRSVESYAADVEATRARIAATIDTLHDRLQPRVLATQAVESLAQTALTAFAGSGTAVLALARKLLRDHPVATAATGLGIGVALIARNRLSHAEVNIGDDYEPYSDFDDEPALRLVDNVQAEASGAVDENPLAAVLAGLAAGALLGALFPETKAENQLIGRHSDKVSTAARAAARAARAELLSRDAA